MSNTPPSKFDIRNYTQQATPLRAADMREPSGHLDKVLSQPTRSGISSDDIHAAMNADIDRSWGR